MTSAVHRISTPSIPLSQNTAPVHEFNCLYTHDVRRKQKRWQDGFLRFHTFNKRVMVYDVPRNFIGDMHWSAGEALQEGDEVMLEKDGVMVEVAEAVGKTETDLTELRMSAKKGKAGRDQGGGTPARGPSRTAAMDTPIRSMIPPTARTANATAGGERQLKHRSLNALLGTPKGPIGKAALPAKSPFEARHEDVENEEWESGRPPKRQKNEPWNITRTTTTPSRPQTSRETPLSARTADAKKAAAAKTRKQKTVKPPGQQTLGTREVIDISDDAEESPARFLPRFSSDAMAPPSSPAKKRTPAGKKAAVRSSSPAFQTQVLDEEEPGEWAKKVSDKGTARLMEKRNRAKQRRASLEAPQQAPIAPPFLPPSTEPGQILRMSSNAPKKRTLACLDQISTNTKEVAEETPPPKAKRKTQREQLEERLAKQKARAQARRNDDIAALVDDIEATDSVPIHADNEAGVTSELSHMDQILQTRPRDPPLVTARDKVDQRAGSESAPMPAPKKPDRAFQRVTSEHGTASSASASAKPKRISGAPVRFTPSPTKRGESARTRERSASATPVPALDHASDEVVNASSAREKDSSKSVQPCETLSAKGLLHPSAAPQPAKLLDPGPPAKPRRPGIGRKEIRKSASACFPTTLNTAASGTDQVMLGRPFQAPKPPAPPKPAPTEKEVGPWSREAFDLFGWRPPNWDEEAWCVKKD